MAANVLGVVADLCGQWRGVAAFIAGAIASKSDAADAPAVTPAVKYQFDGTISRQVLENFLARSISVEGVFNGRGDLDDNIRMLKYLGVKYAGRSLCLWGAENNFLANLERARKQVPKAIAADPEMILEACVFETVGPRVEQIAVPDWVFTAFGQPVEKRNFIFNNIIYPVGQRRAMGRGQVPDVSRLETQMWFYYQAVSYIDAGFEAIHFGQVEIMNRNDRGNAQWDRLLTMVRAYAAKHARRHMVLCNGHTPSGGLVHDGKLLLDFHAFPLRIKENPDKARRCDLASGLLRRHLQQEQGRRDIQRLEVRAPALPGGTRQLWRPAGRRESPGREASGSGATMRSPGLRTRASNTAPTG